MIKLTMETTTPRYRYERSKMNVVTMYEEAMPSNQLAGGRIAPASYYTFNFTFKDGLQANRFTRILGHTSKVRGTEMLQHTSASYSISEDVLTNLERYSKLTTLSVSKILILMWYTNRVPDLPVSFLNYLSTRLSLLKTSQWNVTKLIFSADIEHKFHCGSEYATRTYDLHSTLNDYLTYINPDVYETFPTNESALGTYISDCGTVFKDTTVANLSRVPLFMLEKLSKVAEDKMMYLDTHQLASNPPSQELTQLLYSTDISNRTALYILQNKLYKAGYLTASI